MNLVELLEHKSCTVDFGSREKEEALKELAALAAKSPALEGISAEAVLEKLVEREGQGSTGFGNEIAIPHARIKGMERFIYFIAKSKRGVNFEALDKKKVKIFFVILGPEEAVNDHLKILAGISRTVSHTNVKKELLAAPTRPALTESFLKNVQEAGRSKTEKRAMKLMMIILYEDDFLYDILELFIQEGLEGASILDSFGMGQYISNIPLFATFIGFMNENKNRSKTIMVMVPEDREKDMVEKVEDITGDLDQKQGAMIMTLPVGFYKGTMRMM